MAYKHHVCGRQRWIPGGANTINWPGKYKTLFALVRIRRTGKSRVFRRVVAKSGCCLPWRANHVFPSNGKMAVDERYRGWRLPAWAGRTAVGGLRRAQGLPVFRVGRRVFGIPPRVLAGRRRARFWDRYSRVRLDL